MTNAARFFKSGNQLKTQDVLDTTVKQWPWRFFGFFRQNTVKPCGECSQNAKAKVTKVEKQTNKGCNGRASN